MLVKISHHNKTLIYFYNLQQLHLCIIDTELTITPLESTVTQNTDWPLLKWHAIELITVGDHRSTFILIHLLLPFLAWKPKAWPERMLRNFSSLWRCFKQREPGWVVTQRHLLFIITWHAEDLKSIKQNTKTASFISKETLLHHLFSEADFLSVLNNKQQANLTMIP